MPAVVIHGVAVRGADWWRTSGIEDGLQRHIAPVLRKGEKFNIYPVYWGGDFGVKFAWNHRSLPGDETRAFAMALAQSPALLTTDEQRTRLVMTSPAPSKPIEQALFLQAHGRAPIPHAVGTLSESALTERFETALSARAADRKPDMKYAHALAAIRGAVHDLYAPGRAVQTITYQQVEQHAAALLRQRAQDDGGLLQGLGNLIVAAILRAHRGDGDAVARALAGYRRPMNDFVTTFFGDIFIYMNARGSPDAPGKIVTAFLDALTLAAKEKAQTGEAILVLSHSMGGQIVYDALTAVLTTNAAYAGITVDYWCAAASQVGLFEEMKLFWTSDPAYSKATGKPAPSPPASVLKTWISVWDPTDVASFTTAPVFDNRVIDVNFESGWAPPASHGGYLQLDGFYKRLRNTILNPSAHTWNVKPA
jgi:hypothetical protein